MSDASTVGNRFEDRRELRTVATPEQAYRAWADPSIIQGWFADEAEGEAVPGGTLVFRFPDFGLSYPLEVIEAKSPERLVLRMSFPGRPPVTQEIVVRTDSGETVIELTNSGFGEEEWDGQWAGIDSGWRMAFAQLAHYLEQWFGRRRTTYLAMRPAPFTWDRLCDLQRRGDLLEQWLVQSGTMGAASPLDERGRSVSLALRDMTHLSGHVLEVTDRELIVSWQEMEGTLELKGFAMGPQTRMVGLRMSSWSAAPPAHALVTGWMNGALERLGALTS